MISARIIADSVSTSGSRLTTFVLRYPRFIHAEFMTHRTLSRNAASSRAIPVNKFIKDVLTTPAVPVYWGSNKPGMQAGDELVGWRLNLSKALWVLSGVAMCGVAKMFEWIGLHKQIANRILEPWFYIEVVCTGTDFGNLYNLRAHKDAQPEFRELALQMIEAQKESQPKLLESGQWHLPFITPFELDTYGEERCRRMSVARCARVSYKNHDGSAPDLEKDLKLWKKLLDSGHVSPFEHQASPMLGPYEVSGNFHGWSQYRKLLPNENRPIYKPEGT